MNSTLTTRLAALIAAAATTFVLFQSVALMGHPAAGQQVLMAQATSATALR